jgi:hypothetical protein
VLEGDPENWVAVARAIGGCVRELGWRQREPAVRSHAAVTTAETAFLSRFSASWTSGHADALRMRSAVTVHRVFPAVAAPWTW